MRRLLLLGFIITMCACNSEDVANTPDTSISTYDTLPKKDTSLAEEVHPNQDFIEFYESFITGLSNKEITSFIHPIHGVYVIHSNGAMPQIDKMHTNDQFMKLFNAKLKFKDHIDSLKLAPKFESLPEVICDDNTYNKTGCFAAESNLLSGSGIWNYSDINEKEKQSIQFATETVKITLINTFLFTLYFSKTEEEFKVTFIDIRTPCAA